MPFPVAYSETLYDLADCIRETLGQIADHLNLNTIYKIIASGRNAKPEANED